MAKHNEIIGHWFYNDIFGHRGQLPTVKNGRYFLRNLMNIAAADGALSDGERRWMIGYALACGHSEEMINEIRTYQAGVDTKVCKELVANCDQTFVKMTRKGILYFGIRAAAADEELHEKEVEAIYNLAQYLDLTREQVKEIEDLYHEEEKLRQKRLSILYPKGVQTALDSFDKHK